MTGFFLYIIFIISSSDLNWGYILLVWLDFKSILHSCLLKYMTCISTCTNFLDYFCQVVGESDIWRLYAELTNSAQNQTDETQQKVGNNCHLQTPLCNQRDAYNNRWAITVIYRHVNVITDAYNKRWAITVIFLDKLM